MAVEGIKELVINDVFSKGYIQPSGEYTMLSAFSPDCRNIRLNNQNTIVRPGFQTKAKDVTILGKKIRGINSNNGNLYIALDGKLKTVNLSTGVYTDVGTLNGDYDTNFVNYAGYSIICDGVGQPYVYSGSVLSPVGNTGITGATINTVGTGYYNYSQITVVQSGATLGTVIPDYIDTNIGSIVTMHVSGPGSGYSVASGLSTTGGGGTGFKVNITSVGTNIEEGAYPRFGDSFINGVYLAGGGEKKNVLYISRGVTKDNPQYCYDFVGTGSERLYMKSDILGLCSTLNRLFIFTERDGIRYISKETTVSVGGLAATDTLPISGSTGNIPASNRAVVRADDLVFFFTATKQIKSLNYIPGITEVSIGNISERPSQSIRDFMDSLDDDQSACFGYFNGNSRTVHRHVKTKGAPFNDRVLVYDVINDTFLIDDNKFMSCAVYHDDKYYAGSSINSYVYEDEVGYDDDGMSINRYRDTKNMNFGNQNVRKTYRGVGIVGQISALAQIKVEVIVDGQSEHISYINGAGLPGAGLGAGPTAFFPIGGEHSPSVLQSFNKLISKGNIRVKGYLLKVRYSGSCKGDQVILSAMSVDVVTNNTVQLSDKI